MTSNTGSIPRRLAGAAVNRMLETREKVLTDIAVEKALSIFERQQRTGRASNIAVLGPPGSGKSLFLSRLLHIFNENEKYAPTRRCLKIDLRKLPVGTLDEMYTTVNWALLHKARRIGLELDSEVKLQIPHLRFEEILRRLLGCVKGDLIAFFDHLESVPRFFASDLNHRFRNFIEASEQKYEYRRLGFIVAGSVSLFDLKQETDSAYSMFDLILLPDLRPEVCLHLVKDRLKALLLEDAAQQVVELLSRETSGEPGFLDPVIQVLKKNHHEALTEDVIRSAIDEICYNSQVPSLRHLALHLWADRDLREVVHHLRQRSTVTPVFVTADIDRHQLSGAVVVSSDLGFHSYRFRNEMVARYMEALLDALEGNCSESYRQTPIVEYLMSLEQVKLKCLQAEQVWECVKYLGEAWKKITRYSLPDICLYLTKQESNHGWWFDARRKEITGPESCETSSESTKLAAFSAVRSQHTSLGSLTNGMRSFFCWDKERVSVGVPLLLSDALIVVVATLPRTEIGNDFTEFALCHWIRFVQVVKQSIYMLMLAEFGKQKLTEGCASPVENSIKNINIPIGGAEKDRVKHLYWVPHHGALVCSTGEVLHFQGTIDQESINDLNDMCRDLVTRWSNRAHFYRQLSAVSRHFHKGLNAIPDLFARLLPDDHTSHLVITTDTKGLALPFELLAYENKQLALLMPVSRRLMSSRISLKLSRTFHQLFTSHVAKREVLRVLLIASDAGGELPDTGAELSQIRKHIQIGCDRVGLNVQFKEIPAAEATTEKVESELIDNSPYHILHYAGHVRHHSESADASGVVLRGKDDEPEVISCDLLSHWVNRAGIWLAYVSACNSSMVSSSELGVSQRYLGTIEALIRAGIPNVVGFRCLVSDRGALQLASEFYRQLFEKQDKKDLGLAMFEARTRLVGRPDSFDAWASSMLVTQIV
ncbi:MAG TPA: CHAT domain-containing protein [Blastocatellia bacterium]|nr:CHAT domain-containing protein [Blastocatellia bacterium]